MNNEGIVIKSTGSWYLVETPSGNIVNCKIKGKFKTSGIKTTNPVAVGDKVQFDFVDNDNVGIITKIFPRNNYIIRKSTNLSKSEQIIAANIDYCIIIATIKQPRTSTGFIDRILTTAEAYHIPSVIVFNKLDLYDDNDLERLAELMYIYENAGYKVIVTSAVKNIGLEEFRNLLKDKVSLITGHSGVGKSALINTIIPESDIKIGDISQYHEKGKHTTTFATMYKLPIGGYIIDTPGIKEFGLADMDKIEIAERFPEIRKFQHECRFNNCTHTNEPGCAVKEAVEEGLIPEERYNSYLSIISDDYLNKNNYD
ncbi:MAG: ribosome small subunit-dependent GTPase A [Bacteroidales bacterium]|jgi:ribosome biogenesis GTPase|nr:ribosome small subunit-dependent GTPase A [Bacteroidales bacterium]